MIQPQNDSNITKNEKTNHELKANDMVDVFSDSITEYSRRNSLGNVSDETAETSEVSETNTNLSHVRVEQSSEVQVGDAIIYNGPVTIQQYVIKEKEPMPTQEPTQQDVNRKRKVALRDSLYLKNYIFCKTVTLLTGIIIVVCIIAVVQSLSQTSTEVVLTLVDREEWHGRAPNYTKTLPLELPATRVIIIHTVSEPCFNMETCSLQMRFIQDLHMDVNKWGNVGYNFVVGGDGKIYVGRGWKTEGAHTYRFNKRSIGIAFIGDYTLKLPPKISLKAVKLLLAEGIRLNTLSLNYKLFGHRQLIMTESPGEALFKEIQTWQHWTANVHGD